MRTQRIRAVDRHPGGIQPPVDRLRDRIKRQKQAGGILEEREAWTISIGTSCGRVGDADGLRNRIRYLKSVYAQYQEAKRGPLGGQPAPGRLDAKSTATAASASST